MDQLRHQLLAVLASAVFLMLASCQMLFPPPLAIVGSGPAAGRYASVGGLSAWVAFSHSLNHGTAEKGILLKENGATMEVVYSWDGQRVTLTPVKGFTLGNRYDLTVASTVEDDQGTDLGSNFTLTFYTRLDDARPTAAVTAPANGSSTTDLFQPITITFSKAVDRASFYSSLTLTPSVKASYAWGSGDTSVVVTPLVALTTPAVYTVKVGSSLTDTQGNQMGTDVSSWFSEGTVAPGPMVVSATNTSGTFTLTPIANPSGTVSYNAGFDRTWGLVLTFSTPVQRSGLDSLISVEPSWNFTVPYTSASSATVSLVPGASLQYGTIYTLTVLKGVADVAGNLSTADTVFRFRVDAPTSSPPALQSITFATNDSSQPTQVIAGDHSTDYMTLNVSKFNQSASLTHVDLTFTVAQGANLDAASIMSHFSISATDSSTVAAINAVGLPSPLGSTTQTIQVSFMFTKGGSGLLLFKLSSGLSDTQGNATLADQTWPVLE